MTDPRPNGPAHPEVHGITGEAMRLLASLTRHLQALGALAGLEFREAAGTYVRVAVALVSVLLSAAFGYVFVLFFVAFALDRFLGVDWLWIALGFAILHLLAAAGGLLYVKKWSVTPVFRATAEEIRRDVTALRGDAAPPPPVPLA